MPTYVSTGTTPIPSLQTVTRTVIVGPATTQGAMSLTTFYHYTSYNGMRGIKESKEIDVSPANHSHFGTGTYGTSLPPWSGKVRIARNNWKRHGKYYIRNGKCEWAIEVKIPSQQVKHVRPGGRDILVFEGGPLKLDGFTWKAMEVDDNVPGDETPSEDSDDSDFDFY